MREILFRGKRIDNGEWVEGPAFNKQYDMYGKEHYYWRVLMDNLYVIMPRYHGRQMFYDYFKSFLMYGHDTLAERYVDFEKTHPKIPERPITYVAEPTSFEGMMLRMLEEDPVTDLRRKWFTSVMKPPDVRIRLATDVENLAKSE